MSGSQHQPADIGFASAEDLSRAYSDRRLSPVEVVAALTARLESLGSELNAIAATAFDRAHDEARRAEAAFASGGVPRPLEGVPFAAKDLLDTKGVRTEYGSPMFRGHVPSTDAVAVGRLRAAGAILLAKTSTDEFAYGITSHNPHLGPVRNPWATERVSGGSSGGSAAVLAAGLVPLALGSDTGGSIRGPAAFCGIVGMKPTFGHVPVDGLFPMAMSLDHVGPMARTPADAALMLDVLAGLPDRRGAGANGGAIAMRVGICPDLHLVPLTPDVQTVFDETLVTLETAGAEIVETAFPEARRLWPTFLATQRAETAFTHRRRGLFPARSGEYGRDVRERLAVASRVSLDEYLEAQLERQRLRTVFDAIFDTVDVLMTPVASAPPTPLDDPNVEETTRQIVMDLTAPHDLVGVPACVVRAGFDATETPVGMQFAARVRRDDLSLAAASVLFAATPHIQARRPPIALTEAAR